MENVSKNPSIGLLIDLIKQHSEQVRCIGIGQAERAYVTAYLGREVHKPIVVVLPSLKACEEFCDNLRFFSDEHTPEIILFPAYNILPFKRTSYNNVTAAQRIHTLYRLGEGNAPKIVVTPVETLLQRLIPRKTLWDYAELLMCGEETDRDDLVAKLHAGGYTHVTLVEDYGEYSVRGGIIDIFSPMYPEPLRIELAGDTVDSIRFFSSATQRTTGNLHEAVILPAREAVLEKSRLSETVLRIRQMVGENHLSQKHAEEFIDRIRREGVFPGIESLLPLIYPSPDTFFDYVPQNAVWIQADPGEIEKAALFAEDQAVKNYVTACQDDRLCVDPETIYLKWALAKSNLAPIIRLTFRLLPEAAKDQDTDTPPARIFFSSHDNSEIAADLLSEKKDDHILMPLAEWIKENMASGCLVMMVCNSESQIQRLQSLVTPYGISPRLTKSPLQRIQAGKPGVYICSGSLSAGFVWQDASLAVITDREIFGSRQKRRRLQKAKGSVKTELLVFGDLAMDDLVVHVEHGIGMYKGLEKLTINNITNDFLLLVYKDEDRLYIPVDRLDMVQKYMGVDGTQPVIDKMGGKSWLRVREKAKKSVEKIAGELLEMYASRKVIQGHAFSPPDNYYQDFEAAFPYEETSDQLKAIDDVLNDMEATYPMDRLICGDVGYGKTEIALRAAFKAVNDGKQAAILVPTTLLAEQHFKTFTERFERYPVNIACLSRFRSNTEQKNILTQLQEGKIDIVIGTHRLVQKDVKFKALGLAVIDEEQRFGVKHKEKLKKMRQDVDVLSMSATPIPRTLHMSMMGVRDISVIQTPPEQRQAIISYISEFDPAIIAEAIRKEMDRKGQIFFVHNNINTIWNIAKYLKELVPEVRLAVAHGRLSEEELETAMFQFINREIDMLVSTTIVESGLDIPNANTIILNRAERYGLAQIYQLRGRVGRSSEQAYAYLLISKEAALTRDAEKRLKVLMEHTGLGAGFQIAMNDLKIRGGGAALGVSQSGHIAAVGYDMFLQLMEDAIARLKGESVVEKLEPEINVPMSVFIPESYIADIDQRLMAYRRLAKMTELGDVSDFKAELIDRYGSLPQEAGNLLLKIMLKILSIKAGVKRLDVNERFLFIWFSELHQKRPFGLLEMVDKNPERFVFLPDNGLKIVHKASGIGSIIGHTKNILMEIYGYVNG
ncbi:MAG: transcription-repair coupling factor [Desulfosalsimonadaceae bacterium]|nr:transcription-repair coupling factor [Desulfosalsimonadaceae bacterium]